MLIFFIMYATQLSLCGCVVDVEYAYKVTSDHYRDWFGMSLSTSNRKIVIGASWDNNDNSGSIMVEKGVRIKAPQGRWFGHHVDINQQFIVASGADPYTVYVYESNSPYKLVAQFRVDDWVFAVVISDENTIAVSDRRSMVTVFVYDGQSTWHVGDKLEQEMRGNSLALGGNTLLVGYHDPVLASNREGRVHVYSYDGKKWAKRQTIREEGVEDFGRSVAVYGNHMAASSYGDNYHTEIFTYHLDEASNTWIKNGQFTTQLPGGNDISMHENILV